MKIAFISYVDLTNCLSLSSEAMEERYEHKTHAHIQDVVRIYESPLSMMWVIWFILFVLFIFWYAWLPI